MLKLTLKELEIRRDKLLNELLDTYNKIIDLKSLKPKAAFNIPVQNRELLIAKCYEWLEFKTTDEKGRVLLDKVYKYEKIAVQTLVKNGIELQEALNIVKDRRKYEL